MRSDQSRCSMSLTQRRAGLGGALVRFGFSFLLQVSVKELQQSVGGGACLQVTQQVVGRRPLPATLTFRNTWWGGGATNKHTLHFLPKPTFVTSSSPQLRHASFLLLLLFPSPLTSSSPLLPLSFTSLHYFHFPSFSLLYLPQPLPPSLLLSTLRPYSTSPSPLPPSTTSTYPPSLSFTSLLDFTVSSSLQHLYLLLHLVLLLFPSSSSLLHLPLTSSNSSLHPPLLTLV